MDTESDAPLYLVGRGIADITGEAADCGMLGYGKANQQTKGIHLRLRSRAFIVVDATGNRVLLSINEVPLLINTIHEGVLARLGETYGDTYTDANVVITATHTHCGPGGYSAHRLYNSNTGGFRPKTYAAIVDGVCEAVAMAEADLAPSRLVLGRSELTDASINRSPQSFARNPAADRAHFPDAVDPLSTVLGVHRDDRLVGAINWFATHGTSMTNENRLISSDNKGYAAYSWERLTHAVDYRDPGTPGFIGAFAQTNTGDMSPNLDRAPGSGPTDDEFANTRIVGERQTQAARAALETAQPVTGPVEALIAWIDLADQTVDGRFTPDGREHRTSPAMAGAAALAGTEEGPAFPGFHQGVDANPVVAAVSNRLVYRLSPELADSQAPKAIAVPSFLTSRVANISRIPVQLIRIGSLYLLTTPGEVTIVAGLRLRRTVAEVLDVDLDDVLVAGYSNGYIHYVTTPEEYDEQRYEGGSTMFGKWELPALMQHAARLAEAMRDGTATDVGEPPAPTPHPKAARTRDGIDAAPSGKQLGSVASPPRPSYRPGDQVRVAFVGAYPNNDLRRGDTYLLVERLESGEGDTAVWQPVADDGDWATRFHWASPAKDQSRITITWDVPVDAEPGTFRIRYFGDARDAGGGIHPIEGQSGPFHVGTGDPSSS